MIDFKNLSKPLPCTQNSISLNFFGCKLSPELLESLFYEEYNGAIIDYSKWLAY
jgi:hypothetical protein